MRRSERIQIRRTAAIESTNKEIRGIQSNRDGMAQRRPPTRAVLNSTGMLELVHGGATRRFTAKYGDASITTPALSNLPTQSHKLHLVAPPGHPDLSPSIPSPPPPLSDVHLDEQLGDGVDQLDGGDAVGLDAAILDAVRRLQVDIGGDRLSEAVALQPGEQVGQSRVHDA